MWSRDDYYFVCLNTSSWLGSDCFAVLNSTRKNINKSVSLDVNLCSGRRRSVEMVKARGHVDPSAKVSRDLTIR